MAETIENNIRKVIIDETPVNPKYYEKMSELLDTLIEHRKKEVEDYKKLLEDYADLCRKVKKPETQASYPTTINSRPLRALFDNLDKNEEMAVKLDRTIRDTKKDEWRTNRIKRNKVRNAIKMVLGSDDSKVDEIFEIVRHQNEY